MTQGAGAMQVEKVLDDLISRLVGRDGTPEVRAALIEARRLRNVTMRWGAIPPPPDARREMLSRVMDLVSKVGGPAILSGASLPPPPGPSGGSLPPPGPSQPRERGRHSTEPSSVPTEVSTGRVDTMQEQGIARRDSSPPTVEARSRLASIPDGDGPRSGRARMSSIPDADGPTSARPRMSSIPDVDGGRRRPSDAVPRSVDPRSDDARSDDSHDLERPAAVSPSKAPTAKAPPAVRGQLRATAPAAASPPSTPLAASHPPTSAPVSSQPSSSPTPAPRSVRPRAISPHRGQTIAGIPEAREALAWSKPPPPPEAGDSSRPPSERPDSKRKRSPAHTIMGIAEAHEELARRSAIPTMAPPPNEPSARPSTPSVRPTPAPISVPPPSGPPVTPPPPSTAFKNRNTLMMGATGAGGVAAMVDAIMGGLGTAERSPSQPDPAELAPPSQPAPTSAEAIEAFGGKRTRTNPQGSLDTPGPAAVSVVPPSSPVPSSGPRIEGLSTSLSSPTMPAARLTAPTPAQGIATLPPVFTHASARASAITRDRLARVPLAPGVALVRPDDSTWQVHPEWAGVSVKVLFREPRSGLCTVLLRLSPGAEIPRRRHSVAEEIFVVQGVATVGAAEVRAGDYCRSETESVTEPISTTEGCTLFVSGSEHDEAVGG